jgi:transposase InsO family protein
LYSIWSDNGGEFKSHFSDILRRHQIKHHTTEPYNPEQNGKVERFWRTTDKATEETLPELIRQYNASPHTSLPIVQRSRGKGHMSPHEAFNTFPKWLPQGPKTWVVDGVEKNFE